MDKPRVTPRDFFFWAGAMIALYVSMFSVIALLFSYLNYLLPDALSYYSGDPYAGGISYSMASLIVFFPIFLILMRLIHGTIRADASRAEVWVRRWAIFFTLFVAALTIAGDLVFLLMYFFNGDVALRFLLKVLVVLAVAAKVFWYFWYEFKGYWQMHAAKSRLMSYFGIAGLVIIIVAGFFIIGTPWQARLYRFDEQKVSDLQNIQYQVVNYWQAKQKLPTSLTDLSDPLSGSVIPSDPQTGTAYVYTAKGKLDFELCADFNAASQSNSAAMTAPYYPGSAATDNWNHAAGRVCFDRSIDPDLYPPLNKPAQ